MAAGRSCEVGALRQACGMEDGGECAGAYVVQMQTANSISNRTTMIGVLFNLSRVGFVSCREGSA